MPIVAAAAAATDVQNLGIAEIDWFYGVLYIIHRETFIAKRCTDTIRDPLLQKISSEKLSIRITMSSSFSAKCNLDNKTGICYQNFSSGLP